MFDNRPSEIRNRFFVIMPFRKELDGVFHVIQEVVSAHSGLCCIRADDIYSTGIIMQEVWEEICKADVIIADATGRNANVFYEMGLAHAIGKRVLILAQTADDIPFDLRHRRYIEYSTDRLDELAENLAKTITELRWREPTIHEWLPTKAPNLKVGLSSPIQNQIFTASPIEAIGRVLHLPRPDIRYKIQGVVRIRVRGLIGTTQEYDQTSCWIDSLGYWRLSRVNLGASRHELFFRIFEETGRLVAESSPIVVYLEESR